MKRKRLRIVSVLIFVIASVICIRYIMDKQEERNPRW
jgi:hypothetical protein